VSRLRQELPTPRLQLLVAGVGPLTSLLLGAAFWVLGLLLAAAGVGGLVVGTVRWLALMNLILAIFNLLPGAPLDCGRMLQAILWRRHGHRTRAALTAEALSRTLQGSPLLWHGPVQGETPHPPSKPSWRQDRACGRCRGERATGWPLGEQTKLGRGQ
jgi:hypothetical protein